MSQRARYRTGDADATALGMASDHPSPAGDSDYTADYEDDADADYEDDADEDTDADADEQEEDEEEEENEEGNSPRSLRLVCAHCGEVNRLRPPRRFLFAEREDADAEARQIQYTCGACGEVNRRRVTLARESVAIRTFHEAYRRHA